MTTQERRSWLAGGQIVAGSTLVVLLFGAIADVMAQADPVPQAVINAMVQAGLLDLTKRMDRFENLAIYALLGIAGTLATQLLTLRSARK